MVNKLLSIEEIKVDSEIYPRLELDDYIVDLYSAAMGDGDVFPPIVVGTIKGFRGRYLIDGKHRIEATKRRGEKYISSEVRRFSSKREALIEAVKLNAKHGKSLTRKDRVHATRALSALGVKKEQISEIVRIPLCKSVRVRTKVGARGLHPRKREEKIKLRSPEEVAVELNRWRSIHDGMATGKSPELLDVLKDEFTKLGKKHKDIKGDLDKILEDMKKRHSMEELMGRIHQLLWFQGREN